jgi:hypothetical protein
MYPKAKKVLKWLGGDQSQRMDDFAFTILGNDELEPIFGVVFKRLWDRAIQKAALKPQEDDNDDDDDDNNYDDDDDDNSDDDDDDEDE